MPSWSLAWERQKEQRRPSHVASPRLLEGDPKVLALGFSVDAFRNSLTLGFH